MRRHAQASSAKSNPCVGGTRQSGVLARLVLSFALGIVALLALAGPASALTDGYSYSSSFTQPGPPTGLFGFGMGLAVDQSNGNVYVTETENHRILKFDSSGTFLQAWGYGVSDGLNQSEVCTAPAACQVGIGGTAPGQFNVATGIAVDNSNGPNQGNVYVVDGPSPFSGSAPGAILAFNSNGVFLGKIDGAESDTGVFLHLGWNGAVSVDDSGFVWVTGGPVMKFANEPGNEFVPGSEWSSQYDVWSITANGAGTRLIAGGYGNGNGEGAYIVSAGGATITDHLPCGSYFAGATAFDRATGNFLVGNGGEFCEFTQKGVLVSKAGSGHLGSVGGIDANTATGNVYVADPGASAVRVFVPRVIPDVTTGDPAALGHTTATLTGQVAPDPAGGGDVSDCHFEIGTDTNYGTTVPCKEATPISTATPVTADVSSLAMETTYHYRLVAANSIDSNRGADKTFTPHAVLRLSTDAPSKVTPVSATLNGSLDPSNDDTDYFFEWGTDTSYGNTTPGATVPGSPAGVTSRGADISGLSSYTRYHYRIVAENSLGTSHGEDQTFLTEPPEKPTIGATTASDVDGDSATVSSVVNPRYGATSYGIEYGPEPSYGSEIIGSEPIEADNTDHSIEAVLSGLEPGTTYHFRVVATNFAGTSHGPDLTIATLGPPTIGSISASAITQTTASLAALVNPNRSATTYHFEYGPTAGYGSATRESASIGADGTSHSLAAQLSGLTPGTTYHFRVVATNGVGGTTDSDHVFTTEPSPPPLISTQTKCKTGFVKRNGHCVKRHNRKRKHKRHHPSHA